MRALRLSLAGMITSVLLGSASLAALVLDEAIVPVVTGAVPYSGVV